MDCNDIRLVVQLQLINVGSLCLLEEVGVIRFGCERESGMILLKVLLNRAAWGEECSELCYSTWG